MRAIQPLTLRRMVRALSEVRSRARTHTRVLVMWVYSRRSLARRRLARRARLRSRIPTDSMFATSSTWALGPSQIDGSPITLEADSPTEISREAASIFCVRKAPHLLFLLATWCGRKQDDALAPWLAAKRRIEEVQIPPALNWSLA